MKGDDLYILLIIYLGCFFVVGFYWNDEEWNQWQQFFRGLGIISFGGGFYQRVGRLDFYGCSKICLWYYVESCSVVWGDIGGVLIQIG